MSPYLDANRLISWFDKSDKKLSGSRQKPLEDSKFKDNYYDQNEDYKYMEETEETKYHESYSVSERKQLFTTPVGKKEHSPQFNYAAGQDTIEKVNELISNSEKDDTL